MKVPTGGKAREPKGMIWCNSKADSTVWMKEDKYVMFILLWKNFFPELFIYFFAEAPAELQRQL